MHKLVITLEYMCYPVWHYDENDELVDNLLPDDIVTADIKLDNLFDEIQAKFNSLYIDTPVEFRAVGFSNDEEREKFYSLVQKAISMLQTYGNKYLIINKVTREWIYSDTK